MILIKDLLFDTPIWLFVILGLAGVGCLSVGLRSLNPRLRNVGLAFLGITIVLILLNFTFETDKQICQRRTRQIVAAVDRRDVNAIADILDPQARLYAWNKFQIVSQAKNLADANSLQAVKITAISAQQVSRYQVDVRVSVTAQIGDKEISSGPISTNWKLTWLKREGLWQIVEIQLEPPRFGPGVIEAYLMNLFRSPMRTMDQEEHVPSPAPAPKLPEIPQTPHVSVPMDFQPTDATVLKPINPPPPTAIFVAPVVDKRVDTSKIGLNQEETQDIPIYAASASNPGNMVHDAMVAELKNMGYHVVDRAAAASDTISIDLQNFWCTETSTYKTQILASVRVADKSGKVLWSMRASGVNAKFGRSLSSENYSDSFSNATLKMVDSVLARPECQKALATP